MENRSAGTAGSCGARGTGPFLQKKFTVLVTGGIGSGKSCVAAYLKERGFDVFEADGVAKELMTPGHACFEELVKAFGNDILGTDGRIDSTAYGSLIFNDPGKLELSDRIVHPHVAETIRERRDKSLSEGKNCCIEAALPEGGLRRLADQVWYVHVSAEERIKRLKSGRGYTEEKCLRIMACQKSEEDFFRMADAVIENEQSPEETKRTVDGLLERCGACFAGKGEQNERGELGKQDEQGELRESGKAGKQDEQGVQGGRLP